MALDRTTVTVVGYPGHADRGNPSRRRRRRLRHRLMRGWAVPDELADLAGRGLVVGAVRVALTVLVALIASRVLTRAAHRSVHTLAQRAAVAGSGRAHQRAETLGGVLASAIRVAVWTVAALAVLDELNQDVGPLLAGAGIVGVAIAFGAQSLVKDVVSGFFILLEDQYGVGDVVQLEGTAGIVEEVDLRSTRLRSADGMVWFVPNGEIRKVGNACKDWSLATVDVVVPSTGDLGPALAAVSDEASRLTAGADWAESVLGAPEVWVESLAADTATVRVTVRTRPQAQDRLARELRARVSARLHADRKSAGDSTD